MAGQSHPSNRTVRIMREIQASEARTQISQLLDEVERGKTLVITRHGRPIAPEAHPRREDIHQAVEIIRALKQCTGTITNAELLSARHEGHQY